MEAYALHQEQRSEHVWEGDQRRPHRSFDAEEWGGNVLDMQLGKGTECILQQIIGYVGGVVNQDLYSGAGTKSMGSFHFCYHW